MAFVSGERHRDQCINISFHPDKSFAPTQFSEGNLAFHVVGTDIPFLSNAFACDGPATEVANPFICCKMT